MALPIAIVQTYKITNFDIYIIELIKGADENNQAHIDLLLRDLSAMKIFYSKKLIDFLIKRQDVKYPYSYAMMARRVYDENEYEKLAEEMAETNNAINNNPISLNLMGTICCETHKDYCRAFNYYELAIKNGSISAIANLASMYVSGEYVNKDYFRARELLLTAVEKGANHAYYYLGMIYINGHNDFLRDKDKAVYYYELGVKNKCTACMVSLAYLYYRGSVLQKDVYNARMYYDMAYQHDKDFIKEYPIHEIYNIIQEMTDLYINGYGGPKDYVKAFMLLILYKEKYLNDICDIIIKCQSEDTLMLEIILSKLSIQDLSEIFKNNIPNDINVLYEKISSEIIIDI